MILCSSALSKCFQKPVTFWALRSLSFLSALTIRSVRYLYSPFPHHPRFIIFQPSYSTATDGGGWSEWGGGDGALKLCQNGAKVENATAHPYNVADMRDCRTGKGSKGGQGSSALTRTGHGRPIRASSLSNTYIDIAIIRLSLDGERERGGGISDLAVPIQLAG